MLKAARAHGFYAEVVSPDEYAFALRCGCREDNIIYNGPQKQMCIRDRFRDVVFMSILSERSGK